ncbi:MAG: hypothetical protein WBP11_01585 [Dokdonella sp.]
MNTTKLTGVALATLVAGMFGTATMSSAFAAEGHDGMVKCEHSSACKGQGACKTEANACKGQNACKGTAMTMQESQAACDKAQAMAKSDDHKMDDKKM